MTVTETEHCKKYRTVRRRPPGPGYQPYHTVQLVEAGGDITLYINMSRLDAAKIGLDRHAITLKSLSNALWLRDALNAVLEGK